MKKSNKSITLLCTAFDESVLRQKLAELEKQCEAPDFYLNQTLAKTVGSKKREIEETLNSTEQNKSSIQYFDEIFSIFNDTEIAQMGDIEGEIRQLEVNTNKLYLQTLYTGKWDDNDCVIYINAGAGGEEAQDWAEMLSRMYIRYCERQGYDVQIVNKVAGDGAGVRNICLNVSGSHAYGNLKFEKGVHRLVRISPFDANKRRHTSFASVDASPIIEDDNEIEIRAEDLKIDTYRSGGAGGQHVNKTESAVRITHLPTGIVVQCQNERSQLQNKEFAMKLLKSKLLEKKIEEEEQEKAKLKSQDKKIEWGSQIRSYVLHPYNMVKDHRTNYQTSNTTAVLDGEIDEFILQSLINIKN